MTSNLMDTISLMLAKWISQADGAISADPQAFTSLRLQAQASAAAFNTKYDAAAHWINKYCEERDCSPALAGKGTDPLQSAYAVFKQRVQHGLATDRRLAAATALANCRTWEDCEVQGAADIFAGLFNIASATLKEAVASQRKALSTAAEAQETAGKS